jgi:hypothetical protein
VSLYDDKPPAVTKVSGTVKSGPVLDLAPFSPAMTDGACVLLTPAIPFCSPSCGSGFGCVAGDKCAAIPKSLDAGTVSLSGIKGASGATNVTLLVVAGVYQADPEMDVAFPPYDEGADVGLSATGGAVGAFSVHAKGIAKLVVGYDSLPFEKNKATTATWTAKGASSDARIHVKIEISHHGGPSKGRIECDTPDNGSITISAPLVTALLNLGYSGFPTIELTRISTGTAAVGTGHVALELSHPVERPLKIPGLVDCTDSTDCPTGQTCQNDLSCK